MRERNRADAQALRVKAPAKLNLYLEVLGRRPDGYHEIRTIMQAVSLFDELSFTPREDGRLILHAAGEGLPPAEENLVVRAAHLLRQRCGCATGAEIRLTKRIPVGAGLGGGSSDCAAALRALNSLWELGLSAGQMEELAAHLGSDVAFFIRGGTALCEGRGELITPVPVAGAFHYVVAVPPWPVSTARVYGGLEQGLTKPGQSINMEGVRMALGSGDPGLLGASLYNALRRPAFRQAPQIQHVERSFAAVAPQLGCTGVCLSGSGSAVFGVFEGPERAEAASRQLAQLKVPVWAVHSLSGVPQDAC